MARRGTKKRSRGNSVWSVSHRRRRAPINGHDNCSGRSEGPLTAMRDKLMERAQRLEDCVAAIAECIGPLPAATSCTEGAVYAGADCVDGNMPRDVHETVMSGAEFDGGIPAFLRDMVSAKKVGIVTSGGAVLNVQELAVLRELGALYIEHPRGELINGTTLKGLQMLTTIRVKCNFINNGDVKCIFRIGTLEEVAVTDSMQLTSVEGISQLANLRVLELDSTGIGDDCLKEICACSELTQLSMSGCAMITDVTPISKLVRLKALNLSNCHHITKGITELGQAPLLCDMDLSGTSISDGNLTDLCARGILERLNLNNCIQLTSVNPLSGLAALGELNLAGCRRVVRGMGALGTLPVLRVLRLREVNLSDSIIEGIGGSRALVSLSLENCAGFTDATPLSCLTALEELCLSYCDTVTTGMGKLGMLPRLRTLDVGRTYVDNVTLCGICTASHSLVSLNLSNCKRLTCISAIAALKSLEELNISRCCNITTGWEALGALQQLRVAVLSHTHIDDESLHYVSGCKCLTSLDLTSCLDVTNVTVLSSVTMLEELTLDGCRNITTNISTLCTLQKLRVLNVGDVVFHDEYLDFNPSPGRGRSLVRLNAPTSQGFFRRGPSLNIVTLEEIALDHRRVCGIPSLLRLPWLRVLSLKYADIDNDVIKSISKSKSLRSLNLSHCERIFDISRLSALKTLEELNINCCREIEAGWEALGKLPQLRVAILSETGVTDEVIASLAACKYLRKLKLYRCERLTDVTAVYQMKSLEELIVRNCSNVHKGLNALGTLPRLRILALGNMWTRDLSAEPIGRSKSLVKLIIEGCEGFVGAAPLSNIATLEELTVRDCRRTAVNIGHLGRLPRLRFLALFDCNVNDGALEVICASRSLVSLGLKHCHKLTTIAPLENLSSLESLSLEGCCSVARGWEALSKLPRLRNLDLHSMRVTDGYAAHYISECSSLVTLNLESCEMTDASCLATMRTLEELHIGRCRHLTEGLGKLFRLPRLRVLDMAHSQITDGDLDEITSSDSIEELTLSWFEGSTDVTALGRIKSIKKLHFCQGSDWGGEIRGCECLLELPHLCWVDLRNLDVPYPIIDELIKRRVHVLCP